VADEIHKNPDTPDTDNAEEIADDPILGKVIANYPSDRIRLLMIGGSVYAAGALFINLVFLPVDAGAALLPVVTLMALLALGVGWYLLHHWNREVVLFERGFSYREGSRTAYIPYADVHAVHLEARRVRYAGGLLQRTVKRFTVKTVSDEIIVIRNLYRRIDELIARMEAAVNAALRVRIRTQFGLGGDAGFGPHVVLSAQGLRVDGQALAWADYAGHVIGDGRLTFNRTGGAAFASVALDTLENETLLIELLTQYKPQ